MLFYLRGVGKLETTDRKPSGEKQEVSLPSISEVSESQPGGREPQCEAVVERIIE